MSTNLEANVSMLIVRVQIGRVKAQRQFRRRRRQLVLCRPRSLKIHVVLPIGDVQRAGDQSRRDLVFLLRVNTAAAKQTPHIA